MNFRRNLGLSLLTLMGLSLPDVAQGQDPTALERMKRNQYAVKIVCGKGEVEGDMGGILAPGQYFTAVNVHNPSTKDVALRKKVAVALPNQKPGPISKWLEAKLGPDQAFEVDCPELYKIMGLPPGRLLKGFLVIESLAELDVVSVYTAAGPQNLVTGLEMERVPRRIVP